MKEYKYILFVSEDLDPYFCYIQTDSLFALLVAIFKNRNNQFIIDCAKYRGKYRGNK
jgi:hypothetical protein